MILKLHKRTTPKGTPCRVANVLRDTGAFTAGPLMHGMQRALEWAAFTGQPYRVTIEPNVGAVVELLQREHGVLRPVHRLRLTL